VSWALMRNPKGLKCDLFVTHAWSEGAFEFTSKLLSSWPDGARGAFVCFLSNPQNGDISQLISGAELAVQSPFARALLQSRHYIIIPNHHSSIYKRLWCVYETHLALLKAEAEEEFEIKVAQPMSYVRVALFCIPGFGFPLLGAFVLDETELAHEIAGLFGPMMWMLITFMSCELMHASAEFVTKRCAHRSRVWPEYLSIACCYLELFVCGLAAGMAWYGHFSGKVNEGDHVQLQLLIFSLKVKPDVRYEKGESFACFALFLFVGITAVHKVFISLLRQVLKVEGLQMDFESVKLAECFSQQDKANILYEISGREDIIDGQITKLKSVGRWSKRIKDQFDLGMGTSRLRNNTTTRLTLKAIAANIAWAIWWFTDLSGRNHRELALSFLAMLIITTLVIVLRYRIRSIYAVHYLYVWGMIYAAISNNHLFFTRYAALEFTMTWQTIVLELVCLSLYGFQCVHYYMYGKCCSGGRLAFGYKREDRGDDHEHEAEMLLHN